MKRNMKHILGVAIGLLLVCTVSALGESSVPQLINYQGRLTDAQGEPLPTDEYALSFAIYNEPIEEVAAEEVAEEGEHAEGEDDPIVTGTELWGPQTFESVPVVRGHFNVILGPQDDVLRDLDAVFFNTPELYLEIRVNGDAILPRQRLLSVPYAFHAEHAAHALVSDVAKFSPPIGSIIAWHKNMSGTPSLPAGWVECNGQTLNLQGSPYNGIEIPNLNGSLTSVSGVSTKGRFLRGDTESGSTEQDQSNAISQVMMTSESIENQHSWQTINEDGSVAQVTAYYTTTAYDSLRFEKYGRETRPLSFTVVWIMRVM